MRSHHQRTGGALSAPEGEPSVLAGVAQVLRQAALQVHQFDVRQQSDWLDTDAGARQLILDFGMD